MAYTNMGKTTKTVYESAGNYNDAYIKQNAPGTYQQIQSAKSAWEAAHAAGDRAGMDAAHQMAESLRAAYGYSGGTDGSAYIPNGYAAIRANNIHRRRRRRCAGLPPGGPTGGGAAGEPAPPDPGKL